MQSKCEKEVSAHTFCLVAALQDLGCCRLTDNIANCAGEIDAVCCPDGVVQTGATRCGLVLHCPSVCFTVVSG